jgi:hypothetical protein
MITTSGHLPAPVPAIMPGRRPAAQRRRVAREALVHSKPAPHAEPRAYSSARIERLTTDQKVAGSNPAGRATLLQAAFVGDDVTAIA